jgi:hypothetical protein
LASAVLGACGGTDGGVESAQTLPAALFAAEIDAALIIDLAAVRGSSGAQVASDLLAAAAAAPAAAHLLVQIERRSLGLDLGTDADRVALVHLGNEDDPYALLLAAPGLSVARLLRDDRIAATEPGGGYQSANGDFIVAELAGGVWVVGSATAVETLVAAADSGVESTGPMRVAFSALEADAPVRLVVALPTAESGEEFRLSLNQAQALSASLNVTEDGQLGGGEVRWHLDQAAEFVAAYNDVVDETEFAPMRFDAARVAWELPAATIGFDRSAGSSIEGGLQDFTQARTALWRLVYGMNALDHAEGVQSGEREPWLGFDLEEEPNALYVTWRFASDEDVARFEQDWLPAGFELEPLRVLETDELAHVLVLNVYKSSGGLVSGARAEWSVFVRDPLTDAPRFLVIQAAAEDVAADPVRLLTDAEPVSFALEAGELVTVVLPPEGELGVTPPDFEASIPFDGTSELTGFFSRELIAANDYIYWGNGVADRGLYTRSLTSTPVAVIPGADANIADATPWREYLLPVPEHVIVAIEAIDMVVSPWWNLDATYLTTTPEERTALENFREGLYPTVVRSLARQSVLGRLPALRVYEADSPNVRLFFEITQPQELAATLGLSGGDELALWHPLDGEEASRGWLTLTVSSDNGVGTGLRAEWSVAVRDGAGKLRSQVLGAVAAQSSFDSERLIRLGGRVLVSSDAEQLGIDVSGDGLAARFTAELSGSVEALTSRDGLAVFSERCDPAGVCTRVYFGEELLVGPVLELAPSQLEVDTHETPWSEWVAAEPSFGVMLAGAYQAASKPWQSLVIP